MWGCNETVSGGAGMTNAMSVKDRLKRQAIEDGKTMQLNDAEEMKKVFKDIFSGAAVLGEN